MRVRRLAAALLAVGASATALAQTRAAGSGSIAGQVVDAASGRPIGGAVVDLWRVPEDVLPFQPWSTSYFVFTEYEHTDIPSSHTDADGRFSFPRVYSA